MNRPDPPISTVPSSPITLCVINFNGEKFLEATLDAARRAGSAIDETLLVDNASTDNGPALVESRYPEVRIIRLAENLGPGAARNAGFRAASYDRILFIDNDVVIDRFAPALLCSVLDDQAEVCFSVPRVLYASDPRRIQFEGADSHFTGLMSMHNADRFVGECDAALHSRGSLVTACFMVDRSLWSQGEFFDEQLFIYNEDHDLGVRAKVFGHQIVSIGIALAYHGEGTGGLSYRPGGVRSKRRVYYQIRNRWQILLTAYSSRSLVVLLPALLVFEAFQLVGVIRKGWLGSWARAVGWIFAHLPRMRAKRLHVQGLRRVSDRDILVGGAVPFTRDLAKNRIDRLARGLLDRLLAGYWHLGHRLL